MKKSISFIVFLLLFSFLLSSCTAENIKNEAIDDFENSDFLNFRENYAKLEKKSPEELSNLRTTILEKSLFSLELDSSANIDDEIAELNKYKNELPMFEKEIMYKIDYLSLEKYKQSVIPLLDNLSINNLRSNTGDSIIVDENTVSVFSFTGVADSKKVAMVLDNFERVIRETNKAKSELEIISVPDKFIDYHDKYIGKLDNCIEKLSDSQKFYSENRHKASASQKLVLEGNIFALINLNEISEEQSGFDTQLFNAIEDVKGATDSFKKMLE